MSSVKARIVAVAAPPLAAYKIVRRPRDERGGGGGGGTVRPPAFALLAVEENRKPVLLLLRWPFNWPRRHLAQAQPCDEGRVLAACRPRASTMDDTADGRTNGLLIEIVRCERKEKECR